MARLFSAKRKMAMRAEWNEVILAESRECIHYNGIVYFPGDSLKMECFRASDFFETVPKLGKRQYYHLEVNGKLHTNAAFYHAAPIAKDAKKVQCYVGFWKGVPVTPLDSSAEGALFDLVLESSDDGVRSPRIMRTKGSARLIFDFDSEDSVPSPTLNVAG
ncbi:hypothetical protein FVE85_2987 [Porphyridium purpureum]|uniref:DUF427 domain-containing protein n=1 Tax=Porphyridium purpureum TaxID=35688 RepID=A0A5J4YTR2_PORPP|nr:hypothetical protein FVE85_2987 [Porphyridium purpureum]|eukprot:POR0594..scf227_4